MVLASLLISRTWFVCELRFSNAKVPPSRAQGQTSPVAGELSPWRLALLQRYGGWEDTWSLLRGHTLGHYLSAMGTRTPG